MTVQPQVKEFQETPGNWVPPTHHAAPGGQPVVGQALPRWVLGLLVFSAAAPLSANVGTTLMLATFWQVTLGSLILGVIEALLLVQLFRAKPEWGFTLMVTANLFSSLIGYALFALLRSHLPGLEYYVWVFWLAVAGAFVLTFLAELPFVRLMFRGSPNPLHLSWRSCLTIHVCSYLLLIGWYLLAMRDPLLTRTRVVPFEKFPAVSPSVHIAFLGQDGAVYEGPVATREWKRITPPVSSHHNDRVVTRPSLENGKPWELLVASHRDEYATKPLIRLREGMTSDSVPNSGRQYWRLSWFNAIAPLGSATSSTLHAHSWGWASGFSFKDYKLKTSGEFVVDSPLLGHPFGQIFHLPGDIFLFQFARDRICLYDPRTDQLTTLVSRGWGPAPFLNTPGSSPSQVLPGP